MPPAKLRLALRLLREAGLVHVNAGRRYRLRGPPPDPAVVEHLLEGYGARSAADRERRERMVAYAESGGCRWRLLLDYFGDAAGFERCGHCDNCTSLGDALRRQREHAPPPSRPPARAAFAAGDPVRVRRYGLGRVVAASADEVDVEFADGSVRSFLADYVRRAAASSAAKRRR